MATLFLGQGTSLLGSQGTAFAFSVFVLTHANGEFIWSMILFAGYSAGAVTSFLAGPLVHRFGSRGMLKLACTAGAAPSLALLILQVSGALHPWMLIITNFVAGAAIGIQGPAYLRLLFHIGGKDAVRLQGVDQSISAVAYVAAPGMAATLYELFGIGSILIFDLVSFAILAGALLTVPPFTVEAVPGKDKEPVNYRTLLRHRGFVQIVAVLAAANVLLAVRQSLRAPIVLGFAAHGTAVLALVLTVGALAGIGGGVLLALFGARLPSRTGLVLALICSGLFGQALFGFGRSWPTWIAASLVINALAPATASYGNAAAMSVLPERLRSHGIAFTSGCLAVTAPIAIGLSGPATLAITSIGWAHGSHGAVSAAARVMEISGLLTAAVGIYALLTWRSGARRSTSTD